MFRNFTRFQKVLDIVNSCLFAGQILFLALSWGSLPGRMPVHFNILGEADRYGSKAEFAGGYGILALIYVILELVIRMRLWNRPLEQGPGEGESVPEWEGRMRWWFAGRTMILLINSMLLVIWGYIGVMAVETGRLGKGFLFFLLLLTLIPLPALIIYGQWSGRSHRRLDGTGRDDEDLRKGGDDL